MSDAFDHIHNPLKPWLVEHGFNASQLKIQTLLGDGSSRTFYRLIYEQRSFILVFDKAWIQTKDYPAHQQFLKSISIPVPDFLYIDAANGLLVMTDFGDELLQKNLANHPELASERLKQAVLILSKLHGAGYPIPKELPAAKRSFDLEKLSFELNHTLEHLHQKYLGLQTDESAPEVISEFCGKLELFSPKVFCHRDYHARNIIVRDNALYLIDFQDARLGPCQYDLASFIYDPYIDIDDECINGLVDTYLRELDTFDVSKKIDRHTFHSELELIGIQRLIKAAGSFCAFFNIQNKVTHLKYLQPSLKRVRALIDSQQARLPKAFEKTFPINTWMEKISDGG